MDYNYYENLNVHISLAAPLEYKTGAAGALKQSYFSRYGELPGDEAYYGMDVMRLVAGLLKSEGTMIVNGLGNWKSDSDYIFDFVAVFGEDGERIDHYENQHVQIVKFQDYRFVAADK